MTKFTARTDAIRNRLYLTLEGLFSDEELRDVAERILAAAAELQPGFDVVNDISRCKPASQKGAEELKRAQAGLARMGMRRAIRIVGTSVIANMQLNRQAKDVGYTAETAATLAEAERMLLSCARSGDS